MPRHMNLTVVRGFNIPDIQLFGKMDPYAVVEYNQFEFKTKTHTDGDKNPVWNQTFDLKVEASNPQVRVHIYNDRKKNDPVIGIARVDFSKVFQVGMVHGSFPLYTTENHQHGHVELIFKAPEILKEIEERRAAEAAARQMEAMRIADLKARYEKALEDAREERTKEASAVLVAQEEILSTYLNGHRSVASRLIHEHKVVVDTEIVAPGVEKLVEGAKKLERGLDADAKQFAHAVKNAVPNAEKFNSQLADHAVSIEASDDARAATIFAAGGKLKEAIEKAVAEYKATLDQAQAKYLEGASAAEVAYVKAVKEFLMAEVEELALKDAYVYYPK